MQDIERSQETSRVDGDQSVAVTFAGGILSVGRSAAKCLLNLHAGEVMIQITAVSAELDGTKSEVCSTGCKLRHGIDSIPEMRLKIPRVNVHRQHTALVFRVLTAPEGSSRGFQIVCESIVPLGLYVPDDLQTCKHNKCVYMRLPPTDGSFVETAVGTEESPMCALLRTGTMNIQMTRLLGEAPLSTNSLFLWQDPDHVGAYLTITATCDSGSAEIAHLHARLAEAVSMAPRLETLVADNKLIVADMAAGYARYASLYHDARNRMQYRAQYQSFALFSRHVLRHHHIHYHLHPEHCQTDTRVLLAILRRGCELSGLALSDLKYECDTDPIQAVRGTYKTCLVAVVTSIQYQIDFDCTKKPGERFTNLWAMIQCMSDMNLSTDCISADCEDFAMCLAKLHIAFSSDPASLPGFDLADADERATLVSVHIATRNYTAHPLVCSINTTGAGYGTHTCTVLVHADALRKMAHVGEESDSAIDRYAIVVLEGTALVSQENDPLERRNRNHAPDDFLASHHGQDVVYPQRLRESSFYAWANQLCVDGKDYMMVDKRTDKYGVRFTDFVAGATRTCALEPMYKESADIKDTIWRYLVFECPSYQLRPVVHGAPGAAYACPAKKKPTHPLAKRNANPAWGVQRGLACSRLISTRSIKVSNKYTITVGCHRIADGWDAYFYYF